MVERLNMTTLDSVPISPRSFGVFLGASGAVLLFLLDDEVVFEDDFLFLRLSLDILFLGVAISSMVAFSVSIVPGNTCVVCTKDGGGALFGSRVGYKRKYSDGQG